MLGWFSNKNGNVSWRRESARKGLNATSGAQFADLPLVKPVVWFGRVVVIWRSRPDAKSAYYLQHNGSVREQAEFPYASTAWFPRETASEEQAQKFHTDDASPPRCG